MLLDGALAKIATARGNLERGETSEKGANIGWAISIIEGLRGSLDLKAGGEVAENLDRLYEYSTLRLLEANLNNASGLLDEVARLLSEIRSAWQGIKDQVERGDVASQAVG
jgi:flagellar protein FliS